MGIQVDCRRTDRNQPIYAVPTSTTASKHHESVNNVRKNEKGEWEDDEEEGGMASLNRELATAPPSRATDGF